MESRRHGDSPARWPYHSARLHQRCHAMQNAGRSAVGIDKTDQPVWLSWAEDAIVLLSGE